MLSVFDRWIIRLNNEFPFPDAEPPITYICMGD